MDHTNKFYNSEQQIGTKMCVNDGLMNVIMVVTNLRRYQNMVQQNINTSLFLLDRKSNQLPKHFDLMFYFYFYDFQ